MCDASQLIPSNYLNQIIKEALLYHNDKKCIIRHGSMHLEKYLSQSLSHVIITEKMKEMGYIKDKFILQSIFRRKPFNLQHIKLLNKDTIFTVYGFNRGFEQEILFPIPDIVHCLILFYYHTECVPCKIYRKYKLKTNKMTTLANNNKNVFPSDKDMKKGTIYYEIISQLKLYRKDDMCAQIIPHDYLDDLMSDAMTYYDTHELRMTYAQLTMQKHLSPGVAYRLGQTLFDINIPDFDM
eukprot:65830_1